jgi:hypothetical protein
MHRGISAVSTTVALEVLRDRNLVDQLGKDRFSLRAALQAILEPVAMTP